ncbi:hypothetical protein GUJ93_ZPchr0011g27426 [Zizania palustris]|uniref:Uncharacterized protein n=1 Tax=Zizania palustris TaxID=103762 RepID=A0A8J5WH48_ZIZPA|nr:hypothetical protein GUJ93_ZPchr0011g27426 [Zizania palustris]
MRRHRCGGDIRQAAGGVVEVAGEERVVGAGVQRGIPDFPSAWRRRTEQLVPSALAPPPIFEGLISLDWLYRGLNFLAN